MSQDKNRQAGWDSPISRSRHLPLTHTSRAAALVDIAATTIYATCINISPQLHDVDEHRLCSPHLELDQELGDRAKLALVAVAEVRQVLDGGEARLARHEPRGARRRHDRAHGTERGVLEGVDQPLLLQGTEDELRIARLVAG